MRPAVITLRTYLHLWPGYEDLIEWCDEWFYRQWDAGRLVGLSADAEPSVAPTWERVTQVSDQLDYHGDAELLRESWTCVVAW